MRTYVTAEVRFIALHHWPSAPRARSYLRHPHRHSFKIKAWAKVTSEDLNARSIELHDFQTTLFKAAYDLAARDEDSGEATFKAWSVETLARNILDYVPLGACRVSVMEDDEVGCEVWAE